MFDSATRSKASVAKQVNMSNEVKATPFNPAKPRPAMTDAKEGHQQEEEKVNVGPRPFIYDNSLEQLRQNSEMSRAKHVSK